ncbi:MAG TPA: cob(I)yrinic acid a,c-diamide adenosyltransferase [Polyangiales bacterium]|nr:cob(I)yrinic acid a,c-diamide adenosyltransferase [Polyangiales bacterium]
MKIYTKTGDRGQTALFGGARVSKASTRVSAYGDVDELNSHLGVVCAHTSDAKLAGRLREIQAELFSLGAELAKNPDKDVDLGVPGVAETDIERLERDIDTFETELTPLKTFILPGGSPSAAFLHVARTACRRAERAVVTLLDSEPVRPELLRYLNRLSDLLFVMARVANHRANVVDVPWLGRDAP